MADLSIASFKANFVSGARPNLYAVTIQELGGSLEFLCRGSQLPSSTLGIVDVPYMGRQLKVAGNRIFADWTVTVFNDVNFEIRNKVEAWSALINGHESNTGPVSITDYYRDATVQQLDQAGGVLYSYQFRDIWPTEISEVELAFDSNDAIEEFTITFAIGSFWQSDGAN